MVETLKQVLEAFNRHDLDAIMSHFAEDCVFESPRGPDPWGRRFVGRDEVRRGLAARFEGIPDVQWSEDDHFACGNRGVSEWTISGTTLEGERTRSAGATCGPSERTAASSARTPSGRSARPREQRGRRQRRRGFFSLRVTRFLTVRLLAAGSVTVAISRRVSFLR